MEQELTEVINNLLTKRPITDINRRYLSYLKNCRDFKPYFIYDIGASLGAYSKFCHLIFPDAKIALFEADDIFEKHYQQEDYNIVCLSDVDDKEVKFYNNPKNEDNYEVNSCYKSCVLNDDFKLLKTRTLDSFIGSKYPYPDLIKISCNGSELDIIKGGIETIKRCKYLIVRLQNYELYQGAPLANTVGPFIKDLGFELLDVLDSYGNRIVDYVFKNYSYC